MKVKTSVAFSLDIELKKHLDKFALASRCSTSEVVRNAVQEYLNKDLTIDNEIISMCEKSAERTKLVEQKVELLSEVFLYWVRYYFAYTKSFGDISEEQKQTLLENGTKRQEAMMYRFRNYLQKGKMKFFESMLCDYINQDGK